MIFIRINGNFFSADISLQEKEAKGDPIVYISSHITSLGTITRVNVATLKLFGMEATKVIGRDLHEFLPKPYSDIHKELIQNY